jgi:LysR family hydrogen peroxide-inducible transcriptional activator
MRPEPSLRQLRHFLALAEHRHFGRAAEACLVTQPSLSASIRELENILGAALFERTRRSVTLTPLGRAMLKPVAAVVAQVRDLTDMARVSSLPLSGDLRLGVIPTIAPFLLPRALPGLRQNYPNLRLYLCEGQTRPLLRQLAGGDLDAVLLALPFTTERLDLFEFAEDPFLAVFPQGHRLDRFETMTPARLATEPLMLLEEGHCLSEQITASGVAGKGGAAAVFHATSLHTLVQMVANGIGITVLPKMAVDAGILRGLKLDFRPFSSAGAVRRIAVAWRSSSARGDEFRLLGAFLRDELAMPLPGGHRRGAGQRP